VLAVVPREVVNSVASAVSEWREGRDQAAAESLPVDDDGRPPTAEKAS
jgi:hypothetical protein